MRRSFLLGSSVIAAFAASLCCILPILAAATGLAALEAAASFERFRPYLLALTGVLFLIGVGVAYRDSRRSCKTDSVCVTKPVSRWNILALSVLGVLILALATFPAYSGRVAEVVTPRAPLKQITGQTTTASFLVPDMDCAACAISLRAAFERLPGVASATVDYPTRRANIIYDPRQQKPEVFSKIVSKSGFHVKQFGS